MQFLSRLRAHRGLFPAYVAAVLLALGLSLIFPGRTYNTVYGHDLFVHLDGAWRLVSGQLPNRDFHTPLGIIAYILPALALALTGSLGLTMPVAMLLFALLLVVPIVWACQTRLPLWLALLFSTYLIVLIIAPLNVGETPRSVSFAMYYNRWSWTALSLIFIMLVPQLHSGRWAAHSDAVVLGLLIAVLFHLKATYFIVGLVYVLAMVVIARTRSMAIGGLMVAGIILAIAALGLGTTAAYIADIRNAAAVSGVVRSGLFALLTMAMANGKAIIVLGLVGTISWYRGVGWAELLAGTYIMLSSIILANQNAQGPELPPLVAAAIVLRLGCLTRRRSAADDGAAETALAFALLSLSYSPLILGLATLTLHAAGALHARPPVAMDGVFFATSDKSVHDVPIDRLEHVYSGGATPSDLPPLRMDVTAAEYSLTLMDGVALLRSNPKLAGTVATLDMANPFNALLRRPPPRHDNSWNHIGRTFSERVYLPPRDALRDVEVIMEPKDSMDPDGTEALMRIDRPYLVQHFRLVAQSSFWRAYERVDRGA